MAASNVFKDVPAIEEARSRVVALLREGFAEGEDRRDGTIEIQDEAETTIARGRFGDIARSCNAVGAILN